MTKILLTSNTDHVQLSNGMSCEHINSILIPSD